MANNGKRLTCPICRDSSFYTQERIEAAGGRIYCSERHSWCEMVDLATLMEILGGPAVVSVKDVDFEREDMDVLHPDDFEFAGTYGEE